MDIYDQCNARLGPQQMNYHFSISLKNKYFFCEVAKAGCSSVKGALWNLETSDVPLPKPFLNSKKNIHAHFSQHYTVKPFQLGNDLFNEFVTNPCNTKWAVVRNPFVRALSGYLDKIQREAPQAENITRRVGSRWKISFKSVKASELSFEDYCLALQTFKSPKEFDQHWRPQYRHICADIIKYDHFIKLEDLSRDSEEICKKLGIKHLTFEKGKRHATGSSGKVKDYYTRKTADIIRDVYCEDFENLGYAKDLPE